MTDQRAEITARLLGSRDDSTGGGLALSGAFREILTDLLERGPSDDAGIMKILKKELGYKADRITDQWGSWDSFAGDITGIMELNGYVRRLGGLWAATEKVAPAAELVVVREDTTGKSGKRVCRTISTTVWPPQLRKDRELIASVQQALNTKVLSLLDGLTSDNETLQKAKRDLNGVSRRLHDALNGVPAKPAGAGRLPDLDAEFPGGTEQDTEQRFRRRNMGQAAWYSEWIKTAGWHSQADALEMWNATHPDMKMTQINASAFRHVTKRLIDAGMMERRPCPRRDGRRSLGRPSDGKGGSFEYLYTG